MAPYDLARKWYQLDIPYYAYMSCKNIPLVAKSCSTSGAIPYQASLYSNWHSCTHFPVCGNSLCQPGMTHLGLIWVNIPTPSPTSAPGPEGLNCATPLSQQVFSLQLVGVFLSFIISTELATDFSPNSVSLFWKLVKKIVETFSRTNACFPTTRSRRWGRTPPCLFNSLTNNRLCILLSVGLPQTASPPYSYIYIYIYMYI